MRLRVSVHRRPCAGCSVTRMCGSSLCTGAQKTACGCCGQVQTGWYHRTKRRVRDLSSAGFRIVLEFEVRRIACPTCGAVKRERLAFVADNPHFTRRFAFYVGRRCRQASICDVTKELKLTRDTVKALEMQYMRAD